jgi:hypothetical protein
MMTLTHENRHDWRRRCAGDVAGEGQDKGLADVRIKARDRRSARTQSLSVG